MRKRLVYVDRGSGRVGGGFLDHGGSVNGIGMVDARLPRGRQRDLLRSVVGIDDEQPVVFDVESAKEWWGAPVTGFTPGQSARRAGFLHRSSTPFPRFLQVFPATTKSHIDQQASSCATTVAYLTGGCQGGRPIFPMTDLDSSRSSGHAAPCQPRNGPTDTRDGTRALRRKTTQVAYTDFSCA
jgi:hypothetical protein